jgi:hypothetical protein
MSSTTGAQTDGDALEALATRLLQMIRAGERYPLRLISDDDAELLVRCYANSMLAVHRFEAELERLCREHKITARYYSLGNFKKRGRAQAKQADEMARARERAQRASGTHNTAQQQQTRRRAEQPASNAEQMMLHDDPMVRIIGLLLHFRNKRIWVDDFHKTIRLDWKGDDSAVVPAFNLDDPTMLTIMVWANSQDSELAGATKQRFVDAIEYVANLDHRNEVKDWLVALAWDKTPRLDVMMPEIFHTEASEFNCAVGTNMLVAMVARIFEPGCQFDNLAVLIGGQGLYKSQSLRVLGGQWYRSLQAGIDSENFVRGMHGAWVIELPELSSMTSNRAGAEQIKARLSTQVDSQRPLYKNFYRDMPRNSVPWGTTNDERFHHDPTSDDARRYWPVFVSVDGEMIELDRLKAERDQLMAEAVVRYRAGHKYWDVPREGQRSAVRLVERSNEFLDPITIWLDHQEAIGLIYDGIRTDVRPVSWNGGDQPEDFGTMVSTHRVAKVCLGLTKAQLQQNQNARTIAEALRRLGWSNRQRRPHGGNAVMVWQRAWGGLTDTMETALRADQPEADGSPGAAGVQGDIPF